MSTTNYEATGSRAISNAKLLCGLLDRNTCVGKGDNSKEGEKYDLAYLANEMTRLTNQALKVLAKTCFPEKVEIKKSDFVDAIKADELKLFIRKCVKSDKLQNGDEELLNYMKLKVDDGILNNEIEFLVDKTNPYFRRVASKLVDTGVYKYHEITSGVASLTKKDYDEIIRKEDHETIDITFNKAKIRGKLEVKKSIEDSRLFLAYKISQLNRIICVAAEEFVENGNVFLYEQKVSKMLSSWIVEIEKILWNSTLTNVIVVQGEDGNYKKAKAIWEKFTSLVNELSFCDELKTSTNDFTKVLEGTSNWVLIAQRVNLINFKPIKESISNFEKKWEKPLEDDHVIKIHGYWLYYIWHQAQCARSGTFDKPCVLNADRLKDKTVEKIIEKFDEEQDEPMCPFNKKVHRKRSDSTTQNERYLLSIAAGAGKTKVDDDSTLGFVQRALGLPERCDISGTTTDAVGLANAIIDGKVTIQDSDNFNPSIYILCCITSMCLQGHHSLDEMGAAISINVKSEPSSKLAIKENNEKDVKLLFNDLTGYKILEEFSGYYNPLRVFNIVDLLERIGREENYGKNLKIEGLTHIEWLSSEWLELSGQYKTNKWDFSDDNWKKWKVLASISDPEKLTMIAGPEANTFIKDIDAEALNKLKTE